MSHSTILFSGDYPRSTFFLYSSFICCFLNPFKHYVHIAASFSKMISLNLIILSLMVISSSCLVFIQFRKGICISFASCSNFDNVFFLNYVIKICLQYISLCLFYTLKCPLSSKSYHLVCCFVGFLRQCI